MKRLFTTSFAIAFSVLILVFGTLYADFNTRQIGGQDGALAFSVLSSDSAAVSFFGTSYKVSLVPFNAAILTYEKAGQFYLELFSLKPIVQSLVSLNEKIEKELVPKLAKYYEENVRAEFKRKKFDDKTLA